MLCILLYVAVDEGSDINEELDSDQTKIMETRGNAHTKDLFYLKIFVIGQFKYYTSEDLMLNKLPFRLALKL